MRLMDSYPLVTTGRREACRDFYVRHFGFQVGFASSWFVYLHRPASGPGEASASLAFMSVDHPSTPPGPEPFDGRGVLFTFQVADATAVERQLREAGVPIAYTARREPLGAGPIAGARPGRHGGRYRRAGRAGSRILGAVSGVRRRVATPTTRNRPRRAKGPLPAAANRTRRLRAGRRTAGCAARARSRPGRRASATSARPRRSPPAAGDRHGVRPRSCCRRA